MMTVGPRTGRRKPNIYRAVCIGYFFLSPVDGPQTRDMEVLECIYSVTIPCKCQEQNLLPLLPSAPVVCLLPGFWSGCLWSLLLIVFQWWHCKGAQWGFLEQSHVEETDRRMYCHHRMPQTSSPESHSPVEQIWNCYSILQNTDYKVYCWLGVVGHTFITSTQVAEAGGPSLVYTISYRPARATEALSQTSWPPNSTTNKSSKTAMLCVLKLCH